MFCSWWISPFGGEIQQATEGMQQKTCWTWPTTIRRWVLRRMDKFTKEKKCFNGVLMEHPTMMWGFGTGTFGIEINNWDFTNAKTMWINQWMMDVDWSLNMCAPNFWQWSSGNNDSQLDLGDHIPSGNQMWRSKVLMGKSSINGLAGGSRSKTICALSSNSWWFDTGQKGI